MPIIAIASIAGGAAALAGGVLTTMQTIAAIGSIVSGIGTLTGNKTLAKVGAVASLVGGIGSWAAGQGLIGGATNATQNAASATNASFIEAAKAAPSGAEYAGAAADFGGAAGSNALELGQLDMAQAANQTTGGLNTTRSITDTLSQASPELASTMGNSRGLIDAANPLDAMGSPAVSELKFGTETPNVTGSVNAEMPKASNSIEANKTGSSSGSLYSGDAMGSPPVSELNFGTKGEALGKTGGKVLDLFNDLFRDKDGKLNKDMLSMAGNFVGGIFDDKKKAEAELLKTRAETERQQMENASAVPGMNFKSQPKPGGLWRPNAPTYQPVRTGGLINAR